MEVDAEAHAHPLQSRPARRLPCFTGLWIRSLAHPYARIWVVRGFNVPQLLDYDSDLLVLELTVVQQPFVLDFAEVRLDFPMEFPDDVWTHWREEKQEQFGERWTVVERVLGEFEALDIYLLDVSPRNIAFRD
jgi:hypothetical protein